MKKHADNTNKRLQELLNSMSTPLARAEDAVNVVKAKNKRKEALEKKVNTQEQDSKDIRYKMLRLLFTVNIHLLINV